MAVAKNQENSAVEMCLHFPPFLVHVSLVLILGWISSRLKFSLPLVFTLGLAYLYFVEQRINAKTQSRIRSEERRANDRKRLLSDAETARWLNSTVEAVWPIFLETFASQKFLMTLAPWFLEKYKPWTAKKVVLQQICLGRTPPVFTMLRCGRNPTDGDHLVLEMDMKFVAARDMSAVIAVQMRKRVGFGLWTSLNISNIQIEGKLRVGIRFTKGWPVVERLRVCFSEAPILRMTAKPIINYGVDVTDLPGIANWIDKMIVVALEQSLVEPNILQVDVEKLVGSMMAVHTQIPTPPSTNTGSWFFIRNHKMPLVSTVKVEILEGKKLKPSDPNGKADPYVKVKLGSAKYVTAIKHKTLQPAWYETFHFPVGSWDVPNKLQLRVRDKDRFGHDDEMGYKEIECNAFKDGQRHEMWVTLDEVKTGQIHIAITVEDVPVTENVAEETKSNGGPEGEKAKFHVSSIGERLQESATDYPRHENDQCSDSDSEELCLIDERQAVDVGYGQLGAVSIVTPGKAQVKEATNLERLRHRRNSATSRPQVQGDGKPADCADTPGVAPEGRRSKLKKFLKVKKPSPDSGELVLTTAGEKGTEVHVTVDANLAGCANVSTSDSVLSSGELQLGGVEGEDLDDGVAEKRSMRRMRSFMHKMGKKAHTVSSAITKMSPSKRRSLSGKNIGEIPVVADQDGTHVSDTSVSTSESTGDKVVLKTADNPDAEEQLNSTDEVETGMQAPDSEAETGNTDVTPDSFFSTAPTASDQEFPGVDHPSSSTDVHHFDTDRVPTAIPESVPPVTPINTALNSSSVLDHDFPTTESLHEQSEKLDRCTVLSSSTVLGNSDEDMFHTRVDTFPESLTHGRSEISEIKNSDGETEEAQRDSQKGLVEGWTNFTYLEQERVGLQTASEVNSDQHYLPDYTHASDALTDDNDPLHLADDPRKSQLKQSTTLDIQGTNNGLEVPVAYPDTDRKEVHEAHKFRRTEGFRDAGKSKSPAAENPVSNSYAFLAPIKEEAHTLKEGAHDVLNKLKIDCRTAVNTAGSLIPRKFAQSPGGLTRSPNIQEALVTIPSNAQLEKMDSAWELAVVLGDGYGFKSSAPVPQEGSGELTSRGSLAEIPNDDLKTSPASTDNTPVSSSSGRSDSPKTPGGIGSSSAKSFFSRVTAFKDRSIRRSLSSKDSSLIPTTHFASETKGLGEVLHKRVETVRNQGTPEFRAAEPAPAAVLLQAEAQRRQNISEFAESDVVDELTTSVSDGHSYRESSETLVSHCEKAASITTASLGSDLGKINDDETYSRSQYPRDTNIFDDTELKKDYEEPIAFVNLNDETSRMLVSKLSKSSEDADNVLMSGISSVPRAHGSGDAMSPRPPSSEALNPNGHSVSLVAANNEAGWSNAVSSFADKSPECLDMHPATEVLEFSKDLQIVRSISTNSFSKGFGDSVNIPSVPS